MTKKGIASLIIVFLVTMILVFVVLVWQARLLLIVHRSVGFSDGLIAGYNSETEVNDILGRFMGGFPLPNSGTKILADGTSVSTQITSNTNKDVLEIIAKRQFATSRVQIARSKDIQTSSTYDKVELVLGMDCTGSMDRNANPACVGAGCVTRMSAAKNALLTFLDQIIALPPDDRLKYYVGIEVFKVNALWLSTPTNNLINLRQQVENGFGTKVSNSSACVIPPPGFPGSGETSLGKAMLFIDEYFSTKEENRKKQIMILVTDGLPNASMEEIRCGTTNCRSGDGGACTSQAINYLICGLATTATQWQGGYYGQRNPDVDVYGVTVMSAPNNPNEQMAYDQTVAVFSNTNYVKSYFNSINAENLPGILQDIFGLITKDVYQYSIKRVVPSLGL